MWIIFFSLVLCSMTDARILGFYRTSWSDPSIQYVGDGQVILSPNHSEGAPSWIVDIMNGNVTGTTPETAEVGTTPVRNLWNQVKKFFRNEPEVITLTGFSRASTDDGLELIEAPELVLVEPEFQPVYLELPLARSEGQRRENYRMFA